MKKLFGVLTVAFAAVALSSSLTGCVVAPAQPAYGYGYGYDYYGPGYYPAYPAYYAEPSVGIGIGFGGGGWHHDHDHDRGWGGRGWRH